MADPLNRVNVAQIDAPFPEQWKAEMYQFVREIGAIKDSLDVLNTNISKSSEVSSRLADWYTEGGKSPLASLPQNIQEEVAQQRALNEFGAPLGASSEGAQRDLGAMGRQAGVTQGSTKSSTASTPYELSEADKQKAMSEWLTSNPVALPQHYGGTYTSADIATLGAHWANSDKVWSPGFFPSAEGFKKAATESIPNAQAVLGLGSTYYNKLQGWSQGLGSFASGMGYQPGEGFQNDISIAGLHFRPPWNSTALTGGKQALSAFGASFNTPGLSPGAVMGLQEGVAARGWQENGGLSPQGQEIYDVQAKLFGRGGVFQELSENPEVMDLLDKATRSGTKGVDEMTKSIEGIPDAAEAAHESVGQMVKDMNSFGELSQSQGGTHAAGQEQAKQAAQLLGIPAAATQGILESPFVQGKIFQATGVPTFMQGTLPGGVKNELMVKAVHEMANMVGPTKGKNIKGIGGFEEHISGLEQKAALMKAMGLEANPETIMKILKEDPNRQKVQGELSKAAQMWQNTTNELIGRGDGSAFAEAITANHASKGQHNFGYLLKTMEHQRTSDGKPMFNRDDIKAIRTNYGEGYDSHGKELVKEKFENVQKVLGTKAQKNADNTGSPTQSVMIELSPTARKLLRLPNKKSREKLEANAGSGKPINASASGYTDEPIPVLDNEGNVYWQVPGQEQLYKEK
jgi:hypothetical protein